MTVSPLDLLSFGVPCYEVEEEVELSVGAVDALKAGYPSREVAADPAMYGADEEEEGAPCSTSKKGRKRVPRKIEPLVSGLTDDGRAKKKKKKMKEKKKTANTGSSRPSHRRTLKEIEAQARLLEEEEFGDGDEHLFDEIDSALAGREGAQSPESAEDGADSSGTDATGRGTSSDARAKPAPAAVDLTPFLFSQDPRAQAGVVKPDIGSWNEHQARNKVCNFGQWAVHQRAFALSFAFDRYGEGAISGPYAAMFLAMPGVADAFAQVWRRYCEDVTAIDKKRWALENFAANGAYDGVYEALAQAFEACGLPPVKLVADLPRVTVGPRSKSVRKVDNIEVVAPLELALPAPIGTPVGDAMAAGRSVRKRASAEEAEEQHFMDRRYTIGSACHRPKRLAGFEAKVASANDVVTPSILLQTGEIAPHLVPPTPPDGGVRDASDHQRAVDDEMINSFLNINHSGSNDNDGGADDDDDDSVGSLEPTPPAHQQVGDGGSFVGAMHAYALALRGTTTVSSFLACSAVRRPCSVVIPRSARAVLCI